MQRFKQLKNSSELEYLVRKIHDLEDEGDVIFKKSIYNLFRDEEDAKEIIKYKDIYENLEEVTDKYQKVSDVIRGIIVKSS